MIIQVEGVAGRKVRTAGNPIKMSTSPDEDVSVARKSPSVSEHREAILAEVMSSTGAYSPQGRSVEDPSPNPELDPIMSA
jgi:CoA:oxalate CoA-transferase